MHELALTISLFAAWLSGVIVGFILVKTRNGETQ